MQMQMVQGEHNIYLYLMPATYSVQGFLIMKAKPMTQLREIVNIIILVIFCHFFEAEGQQYYYSQVILLLLPRESSKVIIHCHVATVHFVLH